MTNVKTAGYVTCILDDAKVFANHARKKVIDLEDVKLASEVVLDKAFTTPPPRHVSFREKCVGALYLCFFRLGVS